MIRRNFNWIVLLAFGLLMACSQNELFVPPDTELKNVTIIPKTTMKGMEGIYGLASGSDELGSDFVCKVSRDRVSLYSNALGIFMIFKSGMAADSSLQFTGFWRQSENPTNGLVSMSIAKNEGARNILKNLGPAGLVMKGSFTNGGATRDFTVKYTRDFSAKVKAKPIVIFGHHGIQTTANPPFIENSLECFRRAESYGANGLEVDVRLTLDNVPVLLHDPLLSPRVTQKSGIIGNLDKIAYQSLFNFVRLIDGQRIPTVEEALNLAVDSTDLEYVWLDVKGNPNVFQYMEPIVSAAIKKAQAKGRKIEIISDIPSPSVLEEYEKQPSYAVLPIMYEPDLDKAIAIGAKYWGPRWTEGTQNPDVERAHSLNMKVFCWTLNAQRFIQSYLDNGNFDGFITDYPSYVIYNYYTR